MCTWIILTYRGWLQISLSVMIQRSGWGGGGGVGGNHMSRCTSFLLLPGFLFEATIMTVAQSHYTNQSSLTEKGYVIADYCDVFSKQLV